MKTIQTLFIVSLLFSLTANAQITKGHWMLGGDISFAYGKAKPSSIVKGESFNLDISPNVGYFVIDKLVLGAKLDYYRSRYKTNDLTSSFDNFWVSPFARYYFLDVDKNINIFIESSYKFNLINENKATAFSAKTGAAIFLTPSVALEVSLQYLNTNSNDVYVGTNTILLGFGFQIHLERDKNFKL
ncbi:MAG: hypothetical protein Q7U08_03800 [Flavobacteriaceae bacterium]|nr:hypothetical protein [Flavobacteriaceae bacterium]